MSTASLDHVSESVAEQTAVGSAESWQAACLDDCWGPKVPASKTTKPLPEIDREQLSQMKESLNLPDDRTAENVRRDINRYASDPEDTAVKLMRENRVLGMGEFHESGSPFRATGKEIVARLKRAGATHLAVEMPSNLLPLYKQFQETGDIPEGMLTGYWNSKDFRSLVKAARDADLKVIPVDLDNPPYRGRWDQRDPHMADHVTTILDESPSNKVVLWLGSMHLTESLPEDKGDFKTAGTILKERYPGEVATMAHVRTGERLLGLTKDIRHPVAVPTKGTAVGDLKESMHIQAPGKLPHHIWDYSVIYPH